LDKLLFFAYEKTFSSLNQEKMAEIISGRDIASKIIETELIPKVEKLKSNGIIPKLVVILVGEHPASASYVRQKEKFAARAGIESEIRRFPDTASEELILTELDAIELDDKIHGVIVQTPLPDHISIKKVLAKISPKKDVDGWTAENMGKLTRGEKTLESCTPKGIIQLIDKSDTKIKGANAVVIGRSNIVGKPVTLLLLNRGATVTTCHRHTDNLDFYLKNADIVVVAVGKIGLIHGDQLKPGCTVIDVGINRNDEGRLVGDVDFASAEKIVGKITPVPGGVGPMTVVSLIENTIIAALQSTNIK
jgi:methylenetetrahydrofolate dehydrogenase (NADP+) / methenyltetrahydrofolate cyclohydrolase